MLDTTLGLANICVSRIPITHSRLLANSPSPLPQYCPRRSGHDGCFRCQRHQRKTCPGRYFLRPHEPAIQGKRLHQHQHCPGPISAPTLLCQSRDLLNIPRIVQKLVECVIMFISLLSVLLIMCMFVYVWCLCACFRLKPSGHGFRTM